MSAVRQVLEEVGATEVPLIEVYNKCDQLTPDESRRLQESDPEAVCLSALARSGCGRARGNARLPARARRAPHDPDVRSGRSGGSRPDRPPLSACARRRPRDARRPGVDRGGRAATSGSKIFLMRTLAVFHARARPRDRSRLRAEDGRGAGRDGTEVPGVREAGGARGAGRQRRGPHARSRVALSAGRGLPKRGARPRGRPQSRAHVLSGRDGPRLRRPRPVGRESRAGVFRPRARAPTRLYGRTRRERADPPRAESGLGSDRGIRGSARRESHAHRSPASHRGAALPERRTRSGRRERGGADRPSDEAIRAYTAAIASSPESAFLYRELAAVERRGGRRRRCADPFPQSRGARSRRCRVPTRR